ncbi:Lipoprotein-anchoring transpeptidase ErfK/SrfK [Saccharopolyspora kobensis]|uniref:Lipoprotein-anchoring transpeptidase ErfK/SrfK n=1 Tax=Saccharopolyspora kobensis TaxID=146035 RepID=A0A1H5ZR51_9PSEU|nr:Ig-like domain-containing protein [Saccharopolyspora kobensis]SEG38235.1 Lipoprotein-anchoring transpeptidase ErfK/SrfK [Saccharopolyspora kobensis]SFF22290.1 Lipoprotein-anchoring transpeptidase ErfK/SrfK [Saccharopolyspora kobensis]
MQVAKGWPLIVGTALACALTSCTEPAPKVSAASVTTSVPDGAAQVGPSDPLVVTAHRGVLTSVTVTADGGTAVPGELTDGGRRWSTTVPLEFSKTYRVQAHAQDAERIPAPPATSTFTTATPVEEITVERTRPSAGDEVGIAMPVSIYFSKPVTDRAAVERRLSVEPSVPTEGSFHWMSDEQVNWRPKDYWSPGTTVRVRARLYGVNTGGGVMGTADHESEFRIGRDQRAVGDVNAHTLTVYQDGQEIKRLPASYGRSVYPTQYGVHVAFEKHTSTRMRSDTWGGPQKGEPGYYDEVLPYAVRISNNGEFVHVNPATVWAQGESNVSHGCVNLSPANGKWFFDFVQIGDPVEIVGSDRPLTTADGDIPDWTIPYDDYIKGSALYQQ